MERVIGIRDYEGGTVYKAVGGGTLDCYNNVYVFIVIRIQFSDVI